jgi:hypothetical protein
MLKPRAQQVVLGNTRRRHFRHVALRPLAKVGVVGFWGGGVYFARKHASTTQVLQGNSEPANARK